MSGGVTVHGPASGPRGLVGTSGEEHWRLLFTALVAKVQAVCGDASPLAPHGGALPVVRLSPAEVEAARSLLLVEWPLVEFSLDFTAAQQDGSKP